MKDAAAEKQFMDMLPKAMMKQLHISFNDRVCMLAHIFRVRGHHYLEAYEATYANLWNKMRYKED